MRVLSRYVGREIVGSVLMVSLVLIGIDAFVLISGEASDIGTGHYDIWHALWYVVLQIPYNIYQLFPMIGLIGSLFGLGRLASSNQLTVMRAAGVSISQFIVIVLRAAVILFIIAAAIGEGIGPQALQYADKMKANAMHPRTTHTKRVNDVWLHQPNQFIHVGSVLSASQIRAITVFTFNTQHQLTDMYYSPNGQLQQGHWILTPVTVTQIGDQQITHSIQHELSLNLLIEPKLIHVSSDDADQMSLPALWSAFQYRLSTGLDAGQLEFTFWERTFQPLVIIIMIALGVPFIFGSLRSVSMGQRLLVGVSMGFIVYLLNRFLGLLSLVFQIPPFLAALIPVIIFTLVCIYLLRKIN